jgi:uncharacterized protein YjiS (DUF1127 family)
MTAFGRRIRAPGPAVVSPAEIVPGETVARALAWLLDAMERQRQRRALASLDDRMLRDIGASRAEAWRECRKPFWRW